MSRLLCHHFGATTVGRPAGTNGEISQWQARMANWSAEIPTSGVREILSPGSQMRAILSGCASRRLHSVRWESRALAAAACGRAIKERGHQNHHYIVPVLTCSLRRASLWPSTSRLWSRLGVSRSTIHQAAAEAENAHGVDENATRPARPNLITRQPQKLKAHLSPS